MQLLVGIPAYNEASTIADVVGSIPRTINGVEVVHVVVVDDGSVDDTGNLAREAGADVVRHAKNSGLGVAFQSLVRYALESRADLLVTIDADGQFNSDHIPQLIDPILSGNAMVCTASRFMDPDLIPEMPRIKRWGNRRVAKLVSTLTGYDYRDVSCGFRAYSREALLRLTVYHSFTYTHETFIDLAAKRVPIQEVPLAVQGVRQSGQSKVAASVLRYAWQTAAIMLRTYRDQKPMSLCIGLAIPLFILGIALLGWSYGHLLQTGSFLKSIALAGGGVIGVGVATLFFGFMADMTTGIRRNQEEILYWLRRQGGVQWDPAEELDAKAQSSANSGTAS